MSTGGLHEPCVHRAHTVHLLGYCLFPRSTMPESELPWLVPGLPVYYHRSTGERVPATIVGPCPRGGRRISIRYKVGGQEVLDEYAPEELLEFATATSSAPSRAESPEPPQLLRDEALMDALVEPPKPGVDAESPQPPQLESGGVGERCRSLGPISLKSLRQALGRAWHTHTHGGISLSPAPW